MICAFLFSLLEKKELNDSKNDVRYAVNEGEEGMEKGHKKIEMFRHIQSQIMRQTDFSISMFDKARYKKRTDRKSALR